jgi:hypothetical protein
MSKLYRGDEVREVPDFQVDYLIGKTPSSKGDYIPNPYSTTPTQQESSIPGLGDSSVVQQPGKDYKDATSALQEQSQNMKDIIGDVSNSRGDLIDDYLKTTPFAQSEQGKSSYDQMTQAEKNIGIDTDEERERIRKAGETAGLTYDPLIRQAEQRAKQGRGANLVAAAKSGGLDSSAWSGISSLVGADASGVDGFEGIGGKLAQMGSEYDATISDLKTKKNQAIAMAQSAEREAIITGETKAWERVRDLYTLAKENYNDAITMIQNKESVLGSYEDYLKTGMTEAQDEIKRIVESGVDITSLTPEEITELENKAGYTPGTFEAEYNKYFDQYMAKQEETMFERGIKLIDVAKDLKEGTEYQIPGTDIIVKGIKQDDKDIIQGEIVIANKVFKIGLDKETGEELWRYDTGTLYKTGGGGGGGKTITWQMAKDLGDYTLYGKPINAIPDGSTPTTDEEEAFEKEASNLRSDLAQNKTSWADAYNSMKAKYNIPNNVAPDILDNILDKKSHYTKTGQNKSTIVIPGGGTVNIGK